jgi:hypothetical protein
MAPTSLQCVSFISRRFSRFDYVAWFGGWKSTKVVPLYGGMSLLKLAIRLEEALIKIKLLTKDSTHIEP